MESFVACARAVRCPVLLAGITRRANNINALWEGNIALQGEAVNNIVRPIIANCLHLGDVRVDCFISTHSDC